MSEPLIVLENLSKSYRVYQNSYDRLKDIFVPRSLRGHREEFEALRGVNLEINRGERVGFIGRNGAGKSTLLKLVSGRSEPTSGMVSVRGKIQALLGLGVGFSAEWTGRQNIFAALSIQGVSHAQIRRYEEDIIDFSELEEFIDQPVKGYSAGMYTRLAFAVATCMEPEILIVDEVLGAGDAAFVSKSAARMRKLTQESGATVLFVSHSAASVIEICNRAVLIENGSIVADGDPLVVNKIYNKKIRVEEDLSLRAREQRVRKRDLVRAQAQKDRGEDVRLFRFAVRPDATPEHFHKIRRITLRSGGNQQCIAVGKSDDVSEESSSRLLYAYGLSNWGDAQKDAGGQFRLFGNFGGAHGHAPFLMSLPAAAVDVSPMLEIEGEFDLRDAIGVDVYDEVERKYIPLVDVERGHGRLVYSLVESLGDVGSSNSDMAENVDAATTSVADKLLDVGTDNALEGHEKRELQRELSLYGNNWIEVVHVTLSDAEGKDVRVFSIGGALKFSVEFECVHEVPRFSLVLCIYLRDGRQGTQVFIHSEQLGTGPWRGRHVIEAVFSPLRLGAANYMVSLGFFEEYNMTIEREHDAYCVLDRAFEFKVVQPQNIYKGLGAVAHSMTWSYAGRNVDYDPALAHRSDE